jgi:ABC-type Zn uptake system ZnuABC Zn-binding protein ZnuA
MRRYSLLFITLLLVLTLLQAHPADSTTPKPEAAPTLKVLAVETFLADIAQNVAGDRLKVTAMLPIGADPHSFEPTPADVGKVAACNVLIINGAGFEEFLDELLQNAGGMRRVIDASAGLTQRLPREGEATGAEAGHKHDEEHHHEGAHEHESGHGHEDHHHEGDPHFWLAPGNVVRYVENIRNGLSAADPSGAAGYAANTDGYILKLKELDQWISDQVKQIPEKSRLLVTNHESFGYFADRYGFRIIGTIIPSISTGASPSARQLAQLIANIKKTGAKAIFLETGSNPQLARRMAEDTGLKVVSDLYTHSITEPGGPAPSYLEMMRFNTMAIVNALK